jgi:hypothetical protein
MTPLFQSIAQFAAMFAAVNLAAYLLVAASCVSRIASGTRRAAQ